MSISANSRYANSQVAAVEWNGQVRNVIVPGQQEAQTVTFISHMFTHNDRLDNLANQYYGDPTQWWIITDANPEIIDWTNVAPGTIIRVPFS